MLRVQRDFQQDDFGSHYTLKKKNIVKYNADITIYITV